MKTFSCTGQQNKLMKKEYHQQFWQNWRYRDSHRQLTLSMKKRNSTY